MKLQAPCNSQSQGDIRAGMVHLEIWKIIKVLAEHML